MSTEEKVYLDEVGVRVTNARAMLGARTYPMASITSVSLGETRANKVPAVILFLVGMGLLAAGYTLAQADTSMACLAIGALAAVGGIAWFFLARTKYMVKMGSSWGEAYALQSPGKARIQRIVTAMNEAIARRG